jgi:hypothetical protein
MAVKADMTSRGGQSAPPPTMSPTAQVPGDGKRLQRSVQADVAPGLGDGAGRKAQHVKRERCGTHAVIMANKEASNAGEYGKAAASRSVAL